MSALTLNTAWLKHSAVKLKALTHSFQRHVGVTAADSNETFTSSSQHQSTNDDQYTHSSSSSDAHRRSSRRLLLHGLGVTTTVLSLVTCAPDVIGMTQLQYAYADDDSDQQPSYSSSSTSSIAPGHHYRIQPTSPTTSAASPLSNPRRTRRQSSDSMRGSATLRSNNNSNHNRSPSNNNFKLPTPAQMRAGVTEFAVGAATGVVSGYTAKAFGRLALISMITSAAGMQYLIWHGYVDVNWKKVNQNLQRAQALAQTFVGEQIQQLTTTEQQQRDAEGRAAVTPANRQSSWAVTAGSNLVEKAIVLLSTQLMTAAGCGFAVGMIIGLRNG